MTSDVWSIVSSLYLDMRKQSVDYFATFHSSGLKSRTRRKKIIESFAGDQGKKYALYISGN